jgi:hypothetical protein
MTCRGVGAAWKPQVLRVVVVGTIVLIGVTANAAQAPVFQSAQIYSFSGSYTDAVPILAIADVGSPSSSPSAGAPDQIPDLITANQAGNVLVLFGDGHGSFTAKGRNTPLQTIPTALVAGKLDGDDFFDLLVADATNVMFLQGQSTGLPFGSPGPRIAAGQGPVAIGVGRFTDNQIQDAVVVDNGGSPCGAGGVTVLLGDGNGAFTSGHCAMGGAVCGTDADCGTNGPCDASTIPTGLGSSAVALWDANGDGIIDYLAVTNACGNNVTVLKGDGSGGFSVIGTYDVGDSPVAIAAAELHGTGQMDLITVNSNSDSIAVLDGLGGGTFNQARFFQSGGDKSAPNGLAIIDFSGHGPLDLVVSNNFTFDVSVLRGDGNGNFSAPRAFVADHQPLAVATGQFDSDGIPDVVTANVGGQLESAAVLLGRSDGTLTGVENVIPPQPTGATTAGDVDNDGLPDLIATSGNEVLTYLANPTGGFAASPEILQSAGDAIGVGRGDFNGDGLLDIVALNQAAMNVSVFLGRAQGGFSTKADYAIGSGASALAVGDWNGDGLSDLAVTFSSRQCSTTTTTTCSSNAGCPVGHCSVTTAMTCHVNSECHGSESCIGGETCLGAVGILLAASDRSGQLGSLTTFPVGSDPVAIDFGDFNKDKKLDLVVANGQSNNLSILLGDGHGTFQAAPSVPTGIGPEALAVADFNRDGFDDVAAAGGQISRTVGVFYGNGQGGFDAGTTLSLTETPSSLAARDLTGDSIPDLVVTAGGEANSVVVFASSGANRTFQQAQSVGVSRGPDSVVTADFDGDGRYDAAASCSLVSCLPVLTNILASPVLRGDANGDGIVSAADAVAVMRELGDGNGTRIEEVKGGNYAAAPGVDANGDGSVTPQDALAVAHRLFTRS